MIKTNIIPSQKTFFWVYIRPLLIAILLFANQMSDVGYLYMFWNNKFASEALKCLSLYSIILNLVICQVMGLIFFCKTRAQMNHNRHYGTKILEIIVVITLIPFFGGAFWVNFVFILYYFNVQAHGFFYQNSIYQHRTKNNFQYFKNFSKIILFLQFLLKDIPQAVAKITNNIMTQTDSLLALLSLILTCLTILLLISNFSYQIFYTCNIHNQKLKDKQEKEQDEIQQQKQDESSLIFVRLRQKKQQKHKKLQNNQQSPRKNKVNNNQQNIIYELIQDFKPAKNVTIRLIGVMFVALLCLANIVSDFYYYFQKKTGGFASEALKNSCFSFLIIPVSINFILCILIRSQRGLFYDLNGNQFYSFFQVSKNIFKWISQLCSSHQNTHIVPNIVLIFLLLIFFPFCLMLDVVIILALILIWPILSWTKVIIVIDFVMKNFYAKSHSMKDKRNILRMIFASQLITYFLQNTPQFYIQVVNNNLTGWSMLGYLSTMFTFISLLYYISKNLLWNLQQLNDDIFQIHGITDTYQKL